VCYDFADWDGGALVPLVASLGTHSVTKASGSKPSGSNANFYVLLSQPFVASDEVNSTSFLLCLQFKTYVRFAGRHLSGISLMNTPNLEFNVAV
jgi:hypothetical protein